MNPANKISSIISREDFVFFVYELSKDFRANPQLWENQDIGTYLEALAAWVEDMEGYYINQGESVPEKLDWKNIADMLMAAKIYE